MRRYISNLICAGVVAASSLFVCDSFSKNVSRENADGSAQTRVYGRVGKDGFISSDRVKVAVRGGKIWLVRCNNYDFCKTICMIESIGTYVNGKYTEIESLKDNLHAVVYNAKNGTTRQVKNEDSAAIVSTLLDSGNNTQFHALIRVQSYDKNDTVQTNRTYVFPVITENSNGNS